MDIDYTHRLNKTGLKTVQTNYWVNHHMLNSRVHDKAQDSEEMKQEASKYFRQKYILGEFNQPTFGGGIEGI